MIQSPRTVPISQFLVTFTPTNIRPMSLQTSTPSGARHAPAVATPLLRGLLSFKFSAQAYGIDMLRVQQNPSFDQPMRIAKTPAPIKVDKRMLTLVDIEEPVSGTEMALGEQIPQ